MSLAISSPISVRRMRANAALERARLNPDLRHVLDSWEEEYASKASKKWKETHSEFVRELLREQEALDQQRALKEKKKRLVELQDGVTLDVGGALQRIDGVDLLGSRVLRPVEYFLDGDQPVKRTITYLGLVDDGVPLAAVPARNVYLDYKPDEWLSKRFSAPRNELVVRKPTLEDFELGRFRPVGDDVYEVVEETLTGDTDPFGVVAKRRNVRDGLRSKQQEVFDVTVNDGAGYLPASSKVRALDLANASNLSRSALRNRINKRTGQQQLTYVYEGFNDDQKIRGGNYGSFLYPGYRFGLSDRERYFDGSSLIGSSGSRYLSPSGYEAITAPPLNPLLAGTSLEVYRPRKKGRYSTRVLDTNKDLQLGTRSVERPSLPTYNTSNALARYRSSETKPFGLDYDELKMEDGDIFKPVQVNLNRNRRGRGDSNGLSLPRYVLPKVTTDDIALRMPRIDPTDYHRSRLPLLPSAFSPPDLVPRWRRNLMGFDVDDYGEIRTMPGLAGYLAGAIVNDALDRIFGHGAGRYPPEEDDYRPRHYTVPSRDSSYVPYTPPYKPSLPYKKSSLPVTYKPAAAADTKRDWKAEFEREEREREQRRRDREAQRQRDNKKFDHDWEAEHANMEQARRDREAERERERKKREADWEAQQAEWDRQKAERDREREKLRKERERLEEEAAEKLKTKFDPRVSTVKFEDSPKKDVFDAVDGRETEFEVAKIDPKPAATITQVQAPRKKLAEAADHEPGEVKNNRDPGVWEGHGQFRDERVIFNAMSGHVLWSKPKGSLEIIYKNPEGAMDFRCKVSPQHIGMKIYEVREDAEVLISNGKTDPRGGAADLEFSSIDGVVIIVIETYEEADELPVTFKLNWSLH